LFNITIGNNEWVHTNGCIVYQGENGKDKELLKYELTADKKPLLTVEIRDADGNLLGKVNKSTAFTDVDPQFEAKQTLKGNTLFKLALRRKKDKKKYFEIIIFSPTDIAINGIFHLKEMPYPVIVNSKGITIGQGALISHCIFENHGNAVYIS
jgi:hypothetical protein